MKVYKKGADPAQDALQALLTFLVDFCPCSGDVEERGAEVWHAKLESLLRDWRNAGCPGSADRLPDAPPPGTVRVRIAVAQRGNRWLAVGWDVKDDADDDESIAREAFRLLGDPATKRVQETFCRLDWVEADVPAPPKPKTVEGAAS